MDKNWKLRTILNKQNFLGDFCGYWSLRTGWLKTIRSTDKLLVKENFSCTLLNKKRIPFLFCIFLNPKNIQLSHLSLFNVTLPSPHKLCMNWRPILPPIVFFTNHLSSSRLAIEVNLSYSYIKENLWEG